MVSSLMRIAILLAACAAAWGQSNTGSITGTVTESGGGSVAAAPVQVKNTATGAVLKAVTSSTGEYSFAALPAGAYDLSIPPLGFEFNPFERTGIAVAAGRTLRIDVRLEDGPNLRTLGDDPTLAFASIRSRTTSPSGPVPRMADGKPDLSGLWFGGEDPDPQEPSLLPAAEALAKERKENNSKDAPSTYCLPSSLPLGGPFPFKFVQTRDLLVILFEDVVGFRQIYLDGRTHPADFNPSWLGHSIGRWEGDVLVVETVGFHDRNWLSFFGTPSTEKLKITERFRRRDAGHMEVQTVIEDSGVFTKPWVMKSVWDLLPGVDLIEYVCENNRDLAHIP